MAATKTEIVVRQASSDDVEAAYALAMRTFIETWAASYHPRDLGAYLTKNLTVEGTRAWLLDPHCALWFAERGGVPIGFAAAGPCGLPVPEAPERAGELAKLYVVREAQKTGAGTLLLEEALAWLDAHYAPLFIGVWSENYGAHRLYARYGFVKAHDYFYRVGEQADAEWILRRG